MAGAYTVFANGGVKVSPMLIKSVRDAHANVVDESQVQMKTVLDPRVAYVVTNMMEAVINNGTAAGVRTQGFTAPAAGKTGTSHDGWFAGYTSNLLCIVWIGFDDYTDLRLSGATTAAPIWGDFMKRAVALPRYSNPKPFSPPQGVVVLQLDKVTNRIATGACPDDYTAAFIAGTEPKETCDQATGVSGVISKIGHFFGVSPKTVPPPQSAAVPASQQQPLQQNANSNNSAQVQPPPDQKKKKGFFGKVFGALKGDDSNTNQQQPK
jgi:penicillin-binding protein 1B